MTLRKVNKTIVLYLFMQAHKKTTKLLIDFRKTIGHNKANQKLDLHFKHTFLILNAA